ncbi:hypothetical protein Lalb_Chr22g0359561 [Lupinus albus]|uniref:Uncharacterized protein n=1 Tax=Lupinus albus TaxID=3870 RepID=A0A6A4NHC5_LUPAL|nr:hypothetical protein Lalb_Chr22g0359561 [Lupinus albus]
MLIFSTKYCLFKTLFSDNINYNFEFIYYLLSFFRIYFGPDKIECSQPLF